MKKLHCIYLLIFLTVSSLGLFVTAFKDLDEPSDLNSSLMPNKELWIKEHLSTLKIDQKIAQSLMLAYRPGNAENKQQFIEWIEEYGIGGLVVYQGNQAVINSDLQEFQSHSNVPLLIAADAEYGLGMRIKELENFPKASTISAANNPTIARELVGAMAAEFRSNEIHLNLGPVADIVSPNTAIEDRSFGSSVTSVSLNVKPILAGFRKAGVMTAIKHFPGHGTTSEHSKDALPLLNHTKEELEKFDFAIYKNLIAEGVPAIMVGHIQVPALDDSGLPASLSEKIIKKQLRKELGFQGLVISDGLDMNALAKFGDAAEINEKAYEAGCDILINPKDIEKTIRQIKREIEKKKISIDEVNEKVSRILAAKYDFIVNKLIIQKSPSIQEIQFWKGRIYEDAVTMVRNEADFFPFTINNANGVVVSIGTVNRSFTSMMSNLTHTQIVSFSNLKEAAENNVSFRSAKQILLAIHLDQLSGKELVKFSTDLADFVKKIPADVKKGIVVFGSPYLLKQMSLRNQFDGVVFAYENTSWMQNRAAQVICGALPMKGVFPYHVDSELKSGLGLKYPALNRLAFVESESVNLNQAKITEIDVALEKAIADGVFPGCQVAVAHKGKVLYNKSFGKFTYDETDAVQNDDIYDVASVTKVVSSTAALMYLQSKDQFTLEKKLVDYLPELVENSTVQNVVLRSMMAHQAGFKPFIPFYKRTLSNKQWKASVYQSHQTDFNNRLVAKDMWINQFYRDTMMAELLRTPLVSPGKYVYSDLGYYFVQRIVEKLSGQTQDEFVSEKIYNQLGLNRIGYNPLTYYPLNKIAPTENDTLFRKQLVQGFVHDPGAAMQGGVAGHAGIFSNATDLLAVMQLFLNKGNYAGKQILKKEVVEEYTKAQLPGNRRAAGFDRPAMGNPKSPVCDLASAKSYGHSGFTGTFVWVDPEYDLIFVFLSNRVYPDAENWKITAQGIRPKIHRLFYQLILNK